MKRIKHRLHTPNKIWARMSGRTGVVAILALVLLILLSSCGTTYSADVSLKSVLENSELSTAEYTYNSIAKVKIDPQKSEDENNIKYHVAYNGTVKSGIDFTKIDIIENEDTIVVVIPNIEIQSVIVDTDLEYIFVKEKYDTESTYAEAYAACCEDLENKARTNQTLHDTAVESAVETVTALTKPFEKQFGDNKTIQVVYIDEYIAEDAE